MNRDVHPTRFDLSQPVATKAANGSSTFHDPAFATNKQAAVHRWVPWIAGFSREFVHNALERHLHKPGTVLDPFAGVGTTLVEAVLVGHKAIGFEINPYAAFACRTKLRAYRLSPALFRKSIEDFLTFYRHAIKHGCVPASEAPAGFKTRAPFYSPKVLNKVLILHDFIDQLSDGLVKDLFRMAFGSTMVRYSNYSYEPSLGRRVAAGKEDIEDFPVEHTVMLKLNEMAQDIDWMRTQLRDRVPRAEVFNESFFFSRGTLQARSVDLLITSPPYLNNYHYNRNTRPHLYWLGYAKHPQDFKPLERQNFGTYWQTAREQACIDLNFPLPHGEIRDTIDALREKTPEKGIYGGNGWANYAASYLNDCYRFAKATKYVLKRRSTALVVIGNSILQGIMIPTDRYFGEIAESVGLELVEIHVPRATRVGNSIIQSDVRVVKAKSSHQLYEAVVELRKH